MEFNEIQDVLVWVGFHGVIMCYCEVSVCMF